MSFESMKVLYRSDNLQPLAIVPSHHRAQQPLDALTFYARLASFYDWRVCAASSMQGGKLWWCLLETGDRATVIGTGEELVCTLILSMECESSFGASMQAMWHVVSSGVWLPGAIDDGKPVKIPNSPEFLSPETMMDIGLGLSKAVGLLNTLDGLSRVRVQPDAAQKYVLRLLEGQRSGTQRGLQATAATLLQQSIVPQQWHTAWSLLRAFAIYVDTGQLRGSELNRLESTWNGIGYLAKRDALRLSVNFLG
ncbi:MAG: DUF932 domain-containing protein [Pseudomonadota bacterium]